MNDLNVIIGLAAVGWLVLVLMTLLYLRTWRWRGRALHLQHELVQSRAQLHELTWLDEEDEPTDPGIRLWTKTRK